MRRDGLDEDVEGPLFSGLAEPEGESAAATATDSAIPLHRMERRTLSWSRCVRALASALAIGSGVLCSLAGCRTVEGTGRSQLNLLSEQQEIQLGREAYAEVLESPATLTRGPMVDRVRRVGDALAAASSRRYPASTRGMEWQFVVIEDDSPNAWALPGGKCAVNSGMLEFIESDDELAVVMGHEIAHAIARHGGERMSQSMLASIVAEVALGELDPLVQAAIWQAYGLGVGLPFSRSHESEADELGLFIAAEAGYDPRAAAKLWRRMAANGDGWPEFLSTHPDPERRANRLEQLTPAAEAVRQAAADRGVRPGAAAPSASRLEAP